MLAIVFQGYTEPEEPSPKPGKKTIKALAKTPDGSFIIPEEVEKKLKKKINK